MCLCVLLCPGVVRYAPARFSEFAGNTINLGINTTLSRKLLTSNPDKTIGQTIVIFAGQRSMLLPRRYHALKWDTQQLTLSRWQRIFFWQKNQENGARTTPLQRSGSQFLAEPHFAPSYKLQRSLAQECVIIVSRR